MALTVPTVVLIADVPAALTTVCGYIDAVIATATTNAATAATATATAATAAAAAATTANAAATKAAFKTWVQAVQTVLEGNPASKTGAVRNDVAAAFTTLITALT